MTCIYHGRARRSMVLLGPPRGSSLATVRMGYTRTRHAISSKGRTAVGEIWSLLPLSFPCLSCALFHHGVTLQADKVQL